MLIDCHCHLDLYREPALVAASLRSEDCLVLSVTTTPSAWRGTSALGSEIRGVHTGLGLHPQLAGERASELGLLESLVPAAEFVGEVGLDGTSELRESWPTQTMLFDAVLALATRAGGRVLSIHSRRAAGEVAARLQAFPDAGTPILHWFSGSLKELQLAVEIGCWFSVGPAMLRSKRGRGLIERMPRDRVLPETDGPFALDAYGQPLQPTSACEVQAGVAEVWGEPVGVVTARMDEGATMIRGRMHEVVTTPPASLPRSNRPPYNRIGSLGFGSHL